MANTQKPIKAVLDSNADDSCKTQKPIVIQLDEIPTPEVGDAGKALVVNESEDGFEFATVGGSEPIIINAITGEAGTNFATQFNTAVSAITSNSMRSYSSSMTITSETGKAIIATLTQDPTKSKDAYIFYLYNNHANVVKCNQVFANQAKNMSGQYEAGDRIDFLFEGTVFQPAISDLPTPIIKFVIDIYCVIMQDNTKYNSIIYCYGV